MPIQKYLSSFDPDLTVTLVGPLALSNVGEGALKEPVLFIDGGARLRQGTEGLSVGDGDSASCILDVMLDPVKDISDLGYALDCIPLNYNKLNLSGFLGGRRDHELINFGEIQGFLRHRSGKGKVQFDEEVLGFAAGKWEFERNGNFSIVVLQDTSIRITGDCQYPCIEPTKFTTLSSLGLSNVGSGTISIQCNNPVFVLFDDEA
jgi:thiamine pyrophosphokinase